MEELLEVFQRRRQYLKAVFQAFDPDTVEDLLQETFLQSLSGSIRARNLEKWMIGIAVNLVRSEIRRRSRVVLMEPNPEDMYPDPLDILIEQEETKQVFDTLGDLSPIYSKTVYARYIEDKSYTEISIEQGILEVSARSRVFRGISKVRDLLREQ